VDVQAEGSEPAAAEWPDEHQKRNILFTTVDTKI